MSTIEKQELQILLQDIQRLESEASRLAMLHNGKPLTEMKYLSQVLAFGIVIQRLQRFQRNIK